MNGLRLGGMERQLVELIKALAGTEVKPSLAILNTKGPYSEIVEQYLDEPVIYLDRRKHKIPATLRAINTLIKEKQIDILHVQDSFSCFYALPVAKWNKVPLVNGMIRHAGVSKGLEYLFQKWMLNFSDFIVANSQAGLDFYKTKRGVVVYNLIDLSRFETTKGDIGNVIMVANFSQYKDQKTLLLAGSKLIKEGLVNKIGFIGEGSHKVTYEHLAKDLGIQENTIFYGRISNVEDEIKNYGIGVLCSTKKYREGISNSVLEYMGVGLIAVASDSGATKEIINHGVNGFLFEAEDHQSLYETLKSVFTLRDLVEIKKNAKQTLEQKFDIHLNIQKIIGIYRSVYYNKN